MKDSFMAEQNASTAKCKSNLQGMYDDNVEGRLIDGIMPFQEKYLGNSYIDVYDYFCRINAEEEPVVSNVPAMYQTGLELQQKLDKIMDYDKCNPDSAKLMGLASYCKELFKEQKFYFW